MKRHITLTIAAAALTLVGVLAGCTNGGGSSPAPAASTAPAASAATPASAAPASAAPAASVAPASGGYGY